MGVIAPVLLAAGATAGTAATATTAATIATAGAGIARGISGARAGRASAQDAANQSEFARIRADEVEGARREELSRTLSSFQAARGANGQNTTSATARVIADNIRRVSTEDRNAEVGNIRREASALSQTARSRARGARSSLLNGFIDSAPSLFSLFQ